MALPCDLHAASYRATIEAGKHLYGAKPLGLTLAECEAVDEAARKAPETVVHVGFQRRSNPRYREGIELVRRGEIGQPIEARAIWSSSNGPVSGHDGWLGRRARSGDWMIEQGVHVWDFLSWIAGGPPSEANGWGDRSVFAGLQPGRDVTDYYHVDLKWPSGFRASLVHSWVDPADDAFTGVRQLVVGTAGGIDFSSGAVTYRERGRPRSSIHPGSLPDTRLALEAFLAAVRADGPTTPPVSLAEAGEATRVGLLVRRAVDERRTVRIEEVGPLG